MEEIKESNRIQKKITIDDIAKNLGCSKTTVSRAISGKGRISQPTRERVLRYIEELGYQPNGIAKSLADSKTYNIAVVLPDDQDLNEMSFFQNCLRGICEMAGGLDYDVIVTTVGDNNITGLSRIIQNRKVDGVILTRSLLHDIPAEYLKKTGIPFVIIGTSEDHEIVQIDNHHIEACRELTSVLIMQKMKRLALIGGNLNHVVSQKRYQGFTEGCAKNLMDINQDLIYLNSNTKILVDKAVDEILKKRVDCIVCMDDKICSYVLLRLMEESVCVPRDIRVASFYNSMFLESHNPPITALKFNEKALGSAACKVLLDQLAGREVPKKTLLNYEIALKASTKTM